TDVAQVDGEVGGGSLTKHTQAYFENAAPLVPGPQEGSSMSYLLVPASNAGKAYGEQAKHLLPNLQVLGVAGQADLMFCREQPALELEDTERVFQSCRAAYEEAVNVVNASPHSRFDVTDWVPLSP